MLANLQYVFVCAIFNSTGSRTALLAPHIFKIWRSSRRPSPALVCMMRIIRAGFRCRSSGMSGEYYRMDYRMDVLMFGASCCVFEMRGGAISACFYFLVVMRILGLYVRLWQVRID